MSSSFFRQVFAGKTIGRILFNEAVEKHCSGLSGRVVDLAGGGSPSYRKFLPQGVALISTDYKKGPGVDLVVNLNDPLPFEDNSEEFLLCFNAIYILEDRVLFLREIFRTLRPGGKLFLSSPFISNEMSEPHDYVRLTQEGLRREFLCAGFSDVSITPYGERATAAAFLLHPILHFNTLRYFVYVLAIFLDRMTPVRLKESHPAPIGYFVVARK